MSSVPGGRVVVGDAAVNAKRWAPSIASVGIHDSEVTSPSWRMVFRWSWVKPEPAGLG